MLEILLIATLNHVVLYHSFDFKDVEFGEG